MDIVQQVPRLELNDGNTIPALGFGVWQIPDEQAHASVATALEVGYRSIDTAMIYGNETGVGRAIAESAIAREELFITTKLWNSDQGYDTTIAACQESLDRLGLEYLDLYLIHWPVPAKGAFIETFRAFQQLKADGLIRSLGVSNFTEKHLDELIAATGEVPAVNQVELHPAFPQPALRSAHRKLGIATEAWSPLGQGTLLDNPVIVQIASAHSKTAAQVIIRWHLQLGNIVIPKSATPSRITENFAVHDFVLSPEELSSIGSVTGSGRIGPDPEIFG
ncbi:MAG: aldo/keto reductase [Mycobacteriaceae bacterium]